MRVRKIVVLLAAAVLLLALGCRSSEYYHKTNSPGQRDMDYRSCTQQAEERSLAQGTGDWTLFVRQCMRDKGYIYQD